MEIYAVENDVICQGNASYRSGGMLKLPWLYIDYSVEKERKGNKLERNWGRGVRCSKMK